MHRDIDVSMSMQRYKKFFGTPRIEPRAIERYVDEILSVKCTLTILILDDARLQSVFPKRPFPIEIFNTCPQKSRSEKVNRKL